MARYELGQAGVDYVCRVLENAWGDHYLSKLLLRLVEQVEGKCYTLLPSGVPESMVLDFEADSPWYSYVTDDWHRSLTPLQLRARQSHSHVLSEWWIAHPGDPFMENTAPNDPLFNRLVFHGNTVLYHFTRDEILQPDCELDSLLGRDQPVAALSVEAVPNWKGKTYLADEEMKRFAGKVRMLAVAAYDGCAYVFWERSDNTLEATLDWSGIETPKPTPYQPAPSPPTDLPDTSETRVRVESKENYLFSKNDKLFSKNNKPKRR